MRPPFLAALLLAWVGSIACQSAAPQPAHESRAAAQFEQLKTLRGNWLTVQEDGTQPAGQRVRYDVTAKGSAVVETLFVGTENEMVSVYALEGDDLVLTHYCSLGNQPRMRAQPPDSDGLLVFEFVGGANLDPSRDTHMHRVVFDFFDESHLRAAWKLYERGQPASAVRLALVRTWQ